MRARSARASRLLFVAALCGSNGALADAAVAPAAQKVPLPAFRGTPPFPFTLHADPTQTFIGENHLMTNVPASLAGANVGDIVGADRFYAAGFTGQSTIATNIEAGHAWGGFGNHETLAHMPPGNFVTGTGALGEFDRHATWTAMIIGGRGVTNPALQRGIAYNTNLRSGAIANSWSGTRYSTSFGFNNVTVFSVYESQFGSADVINSSWGFTDSGGSNFFTVGMDALAKQNPRTTFVASAGNSGPGANTVGSPGAGYNAITVGATTNANDFDSVASFSSRGPQNYFDPVHGTVGGVRAPVDIIAPGTNLTSAYYGGETGGNRPTLAGPANGPAGGPTFYSTSITGTSFSAPIVAGAVALLDSAAYNTPALASNANARDSRVIKSVLLNSATKLAGWNNGQAFVGPTVSTSQSLDWAQGAGQLNLDRAYDQYLSGTTDVAGTGGGNVQAIGWDFGTVAPGGTHDYLITPMLEGGTNFTVTLTWLRDRVYTNSSTVGDAAFRDLDLEVYSDNFAVLRARSFSTYNNVEHLSFTVPSSGQYAIRTRYFQTVFGPAANESYGLSWSGSEFARRWNVNSDGNWSGGANWLNPTQPNAAGITVNFTSVILAPHTVTIDDGDKTAGTINFANSNKYTIAALATHRLVINSFTGTGAINVTSGSHDITAPVTASVNTTITVTPPASLLRMTQGLDATLRDITKAGAGSFAVKNIRAQDLVVNAGVMRVMPDGTSAGASVVDTLAIAPAAKFDLTNNKLIAANDAIGSWNGSAYTGITGLIQRGLGSGSWDGNGLLTSMSDATSSVLTTLAVALAEDVGYAGGTFAGVSVAAGDVLVMYTWGGDAELDGDLDGDDYFWIDSNVALSGTVFGFHFGDFDYNGDIDGDDYFIIDSNIAFAQTQPPFSTGAGARFIAVPEPGVPIVAVIGSCLFFRRRRPSGVVI